MTSSPPLSIVLESANHERIAHGITINARVRRGSARIRVIPEPQMPADGLVTVAIRCPVTSKIESRTAARAQRVRQVASMPAP